MHPDVSAYASSALRVCCCVLLNWYWEIVTVLGLWWSCTNQVEGGLCFVIIYTSGVSRSEFGWKLVGEPKYRRISPDHHGRFWISMQLWPGKTRTRIELDTPSLSLIGDTICERVLCDKVVPQNKGWERGVENIPLATFRCFLLVPLLLDSTSLATWLSRGGEN